eukprot:COSAG06_NODE_96_length_24336_cov_75.057845_2_plen_498_part_00
MAALPIAAMMLLALMLLGVGAADRLQPPGWVLTPHAAALVAKNSSLLGTCLPCCDEPPLGQPCCCPGGCPGGCPGCPPLPPSCPPPKNHSGGDLPLPALQPVAASSLLTGDGVVFVGRVQHAAGGATMFDMNGVQIKATVTGTASLFASMSQVQKVQGNVFQVYLDGVLQPSSRFNTSSWVAGQAVKVPLFPSGSLDAAATHAVTIFKDTEPGGRMNQSSGVMASNYITFHGFSGDSTARLLPPPALRASATPPAAPHRVEFLGDSITAGFDNQCDIPGAPEGMPWSESFAKSWATLLCNELGAECHYNAWSGLGMVVNCCSGCGGWPKCNAVDTFGSDIWTRTLATVGSLNTSDPHGTTPANEWDFSKWTPDAVVINLGTNDHLGANSSSTAKSQAFVKRYEELVVATAKAYGKGTRFFLACGPMASDYCDEVKAVIASVTATGTGIKAYLLNQVEFEDGKNSTYGKVCAYGHPGSQIDAAIAKNGSAFISATMGW